MAKLEVLANKKFKIMEDYDKRKRTLEDHAVKMVLEQMAPNANLPMIPSPSSAVFRKVCPWCSTPFWGVSNDQLCDGCDDRQEKQAELNQELATLQREVSFAKAQANSSKLKKLKSEGASPEKILEEFKDVQVMGMDW